MQKGRMLALVTAASVTMGAFGVQAWTAGWDGKPSNLPIMLKHGTLFLTRDNRTAAALAEPDPSGRGLYIVQFTGPVKQAYKEALQRAGVELGDYLPENAFLVRMNTGLISRVGEMGFVRGVAAYAPAMKLDRGLSGLSGNQQGLVRITTFGDSTKGPVSALAALGVRPQSIGLGTMTAQVGAAQLRSLAQSTDVVYVEPIRENQVFNDKAAGVMKVAPAWGAGLDGRGQVVAVTDTGLDTGKNDSSLHPDFQGQVKALYALGKPGDASDTLAHGTHVAGSILGTGAASKGQFKGIAPGAKLVFQSVEDGQGGLGGIPEDLAQVFRQAYGDGARVHSNSWGVPASSGGTVYDAQSAAVDRFMWEHPDYTILFAAGNDGDHDRDNQTNYSTVSTPGTAKNVITVGASQNNRPDKKQGDNINGLASFSSRGPTGDGRVKPDIVAPGTWIASTRSTRSEEKNFWALHETNPQYGYMGGTSMATPLTAGATAVVRQFFVDKLGVQPRASLLKAALINGAASMDTSLTWKDSGWGRVDVNNSLYGRAFKFVNEDKALQTGDGQSYSYTVKKGQPLKVTLVWTDYPAATAAEKTLVNDLDLTVKGPDGGVLSGNHMIAKSADHTNNVENVVVAAPQDGTYTVMVKAYNVPQGPQRFSLVVGGNVDGGSGQPTPPPQDPNPQPPKDDKQAPAVSITSPAGGATVSGSVTIAAAATDNVGVTKVLFYADGKQIGTAETAPFTLTWDTGKVSNGPHDIIANAYDAAGNVGKSAGVKVTVANRARANREILFTGKSAYGTVQRYYVDVKGPGTISAALAVQGTGTFSLTALDSAGKQVAVGQDSLTFQAATGGTYTIGVFTTSGWADFGLKVNYPPADGTMITSVSGSLSVYGKRYDVIPLTVSRAGSVNAAVTFPAGRADLDVYLLNMSGQMLAWGTSPNLSPETFSAKVAPGTYYVYVVSDSGMADYQLNVVHPR